jgi:hypothetical protein
LEGTLGEPCLVLDQERKQKQNDCSPQKVDQRQKFHFFEKDIFARPKTETQTQTSTGQMIVGLPKQDWTIDRTDDIVGLPNETEP